VRLAARSVAYGDLGSGSPAAISREYERQAGLVIELQFEASGVRLAFPLSENLE
jgi:hypothetical protein